MAKYEKKVVDSSRRLKYTYEDLTRAVNWVFNRTYSVCEAAASAKMIILCFQMLQIQQK